MRTFEEYNEEIKVESVLKLSLTGSVLASAQKLQKKISDPDSVLLSGKDLHITLASGPWWKKEKNRIQLPIPEPDFRIDFEDSIQKITQGKSTSWYVRIKQQKEIKQYVKDILGNVPNPKRVYHVSLANRTGKKGDSVAIVEEERDYKDEYKKFQSSKKMKKYRAELNRYNREKGTYGNRDGKDASHKDGKIVGMVDQSINRGRAEKSRLKGSIRTVYEVLKKVDGKWALVSKKDGKPLRYYDGEGKPSDEWVAKQEREIQFFKRG